MKILDFLGVSPNTFVYKRFGRYELYYRLGMRFICRQDLKREICWENMKRKPEGSVNCVVVILRVCGKKLSTYQISYVVFQQRK